MRLVGTTEDVRDPICEFVGALIAVPLGLLSGFARLRYDRK